MRFKSKQADSNKKLQKTTKSLEYIDDEEKKNGFINFAETREIAERVLSVFVWNGH